MAQGAARTVDCVALCGARCAARCLGARLTALLCAGVPVPRQAVTGFCWPFKAEFDARFAVRQWRDQGAIAALPEVVGKGQPLRFRQWWPGAPMTRGVYDIRFPMALPWCCPTLQSYR